MYQTTFNPFELLADYFGRLFGAFVGQVLLFVLLVFLIWGLPWERLIAKAGFTGRTYWVLLGLFFVPPLLGFAATTHFGEHSDITNTLALVMGLSTYLGLLVLAFCPWGVHRKLRQLKNLSSSEQ